MAFEVLLIANHSTDVASKRQKQQDQLYKCKCLQVSEEIPEVVLFIDFSPFKTLWWNHSLRPACELRGSTLFELHTHRPNLKEKLLYCNELPCLRLRVISISVVAAEQPLPFLLCQVQQQEGIKVSYKGYGDAVALNILLNVKQCLFCVWMPLQHYECSYLKL